MDNNKSNNPGGSGANNNITNNNINNTYNQQQPNNQNGVNMQQNRPVNNRPPINIQPAQATRLVQELRNELALAKAAGDDRAAAQQHYTKAENIKQVLLRYQAQQKVRQQQLQNNQLPQASPLPQNSPAPQSGPISQQQSPASIPQQPISQIPAQQPQQVQQNRPANRNPGPPMGAGSPAPQQGLPAQGRQGSPPANNQISMESFNQIKSRLITFDARIRQLTAEKNSPTVTPERLNAIETQLNDDKIKYAKYQKIAVIIRDQLMKRNAMNNVNNNASSTSVQMNSTPSLGNNSNIGTPQQSQPQPQPQNQSQLEAQQRLSQPQSSQQTPQPPSQQLPSGPTPGLINNNNIINNNSSPAVIPPKQPTQPPIQGKATPSATNTPAKQASVTTTPNTAVANATANGVTSANLPKAGKSVSPQAGFNNNKGTNGQSNQSSGPPPINLSGITKPSVPSIPISSSINVKPPNPVTLKPGNNTRATLTGGSANGIGQTIGTPAIVKMPTFDLATTGAGGPIPDNGGRVLTKRKLTELVNTIGADEGDGKTNIDGDVEELLLDLADEFINSVTGFACRLAKHRKVDAVDVRDVQLHLERNWNIRIPGYAMDEIRATRKWQPSSSYNQKVSGVEISKSVNGNIN